MVERFVVEATQLVNGGIGVRGRLKISQEVLCAVALLKDGDAAFHLLANRCPRQAPVGAEAAIVAEDASTHGHRAVHVGTRETGVYGHAINLAAEPRAQETAERVIAAFRRKSCRHVNAWRHLQSWRAAHCEKKQTF